MNNQFFDIHSHLNLEPLFDNHEEIIARIKEKNVATITVGTGLETSKRALMIAQKAAWWATVGVHPIHVDEENLELWTGEGEALARSQLCVAIGECGFDYYYRDDNKKLQEEVFRSQVELAQKVGKPLMIHARPHKGSMDAYVDVLNVVKSYGDKAPYTHFHFFSGDVATAQLILDAGYSVSVDGPVTFVRDYDEMVRYIPLDRLMAETDSPYAAPVPYRGTIAEPWMVIEVYKKIAELKNVSVEELQSVFAKNVERFFGINIE